MILRHQLLIALLHDSPTIIAHRSSSTAAEACGKEIGIRASVSARATETRNCTIIHDNSRNLLIFLQFTRMRSARHQLLSHWHPGVTLLNPLKPRQLQLVTLPLLWAGSIYRHHSILSRHINLYPRQGQAMRQLSSTATTMTCMPMAAIRTLLAVVINIEAVSDSTSSRSRCCIQGRLHSLAFTHDSKRQKWRACAFPQTTPTVPGSLNSRQLTISSG